MLPQEHVPQATKRSPLALLSCSKSLLLFSLALFFANTHDHGTEWVKWGGIVVSIATVVVGVATGG